MSSDVLPEPGTGLSLTRRAALKGFKELFWTVNFYPYVLSRDDPVILAAIDYQNVYIYQVTDKEECGLQCLHVFKQPQHTAKTTAETKNSWMNCSTWCYTDDQEPLLAIAGESGHVSIYHAMTGRLVHTLVGHSNGTVNDLSTHPKYPWIIASASLDHSIRVWDLRRADKPALSTCVAICGHNTGHVAGLVTIDWHHSGRYIVSGGYDHRVCVWTLPDFAPMSEFWYEISKEGRKRSRDEVRVIHYPHFATSAIHGDYVDNVIFLGDLIISRAAAENKIVLWSITGFHSAKEPPPEITTVKGQEHLETKNGFRRRTDLGIDDDFTRADNDYASPEVYRRCLELSNPDSSSIYWRYSVRKPSKLFPDVRPILTVGNHLSQIRHWDIQALIEGHDGSGLGARKPAQNKALARQKKKGIAEPIRKMNRTNTKRAGSDTSHQALSNDISREASAELLTHQAADSGTDSPAQGSDYSEAKERNRVKYPLHGTGKELPAHKQSNEASDMKFFTSRAIDWSVCGQWCVAVGEMPVQGEPQGGIILYSVKTV
ncbi:hypothetical protein LTR64_000924 [Lithohypha guttulata]|uniref:uncharacterized protein n=1 Tax=Lithohypha guttulata TaxID=1690604 RepID=UPI002DDEBD92|nr:hypothetical protein LTR51_003118 [Lithohypha guttulata]